jgi:ankyrin repeat protein
MFGTADTPVHARLSLLQALAAAGADIDAVDAQGTSALGLAAHFGLTDLVVPLLIAGADVNLADDDGLSPLMKACANVVLQGDRKLLLYAYFCVS